MRKHILRNNFVSGQISEALAARTENPIRYDGLTKSINTVHHPQGGVRKRPGFTRFPPTNSFRRPKRCFPWFKNEDASDIAVMSRITAYNFRTNQYRYQNHVDIHHADGDSFDPVNDQVMGSFGFEEEILGLRSESALDEQTDCMSYFEYGDSLILTCSGLPPYMISRGLSPIRDFPTGIGVPIPTGSFPQYFGHRMVLYSPPCRYYDSNNSAYKEDCKSIAEHVIQMFKHSFPRLDENGLRILENAAFWIPNTTDSDVDYDFILNINHFFESNGEIKNAIFPWASSSGPVVWTMVDTDLESDDLSGGNYAFINDDFPAITQLSDIPEHMESFTSQQKESFIQDNNTYQFKLAIREMFRWKLHHGAVRGGYDPALRQFVPKTDTSGRLSTGKYSVMQWNPFDGWPTSCGVWNERLVMARDNTLWFSQIHDYQDFISQTPQVNEEHTTVDESRLPDVRSDYGTSRVLDSFHPITGLHGDTGLVVLTSKDEWALQGNISADDLTSSSARNYGHYGSRQGVGTGSLDSTVYYGSYNSAHGLYYDGSFRGYVIFDVNAPRDETLFDNAGKKIVRVCSAQTRNQNGVNQVFFLRADGRIAVYHVNNQEEFHAWSLWEIKGNDIIQGSTRIPTNIRILDICTVNDLLYAVTSRGVYKLEDDRTSDKTENEDDVLIKVELETPDISSQFIRIPPEGHVDIKELGRIHLTTLYGSEMKLFVAGQSYRVPKRTSQREELLQGVPNKRRVDCGIKDFDSQHTTDKSFKIKIEHNANEPFHLLRLDYEVGFQGPPKNVR